MASRREQSSEKLVYLRDRAPRAKARASPPGRVVPMTVQKTRDTEAQWLARACFAVAGVLLLYWLGVLGVTPESQGPATWISSLSEGLPHLVVAIAAGFTAQSLLQSDQRTRQKLGIFAGGLLILSFQGITRAILGSDLEHLSLSLRLEVLLRTATFAVGIWAASYALRESPGTATPN